MTSDLTMGQELRLNYSPRRGKSRESDLPLKCRLKVKVIRPLIAMGHRKTFIIISMVWLFGIACILHTLSPEGDQTDARRDKAVSAAEKTINGLLSENDALRMLVEVLRNITEQSKLASSGHAVVNMDAGVQGPGGDRPPAGGRLSLAQPHWTIAQEEARLQLEDDVEEYLMYIKSRLRLLRDLTTSPENNQANNVNKTIKAMLDEGFGYRRALRRDMDTLRDVGTKGHNSSGDKGDDWRLRESLALGELVQKRLSHLQNPVDCSKAKTLVCDLNNAVGYGSQLHHVTYCLLVAYATERTLILKSRGWHYAQKGWQTVFLPLSDTCTHVDVKSTANWTKPSDIEDSPAVYLPVIGSMWPRPQYLPLAVPADLADRLTLFHGLPPAWWVGQLVAYLTRPQPHLAADISDTATRLGFQSPIVGVQIRRTDKLLQEASKHEIAEYMEHVEDWFNLRQDEDGEGERRVYLATDDPSLLASAQQEYPRYTFVSDNEISKTADVNKRYADDSLRGVIIDTHFLSRSDFLVCTFSSNMCRVAFELMQTIHGDASRKYKSLDDSYYWHGQLVHLKIATYDHVPQSESEIEMRRGDVIRFFGNHWDGYSMGTNYRTKIKGLYPSYKVRDTLNRVALPTYTDVQE